MRPRIQVGETVDGPWLKPPTARRIGVKDLAELGLRLGDRALLVRPGFPLNLAGEAVDLSCAGCSQ
jgi:hypothetical protein